MVSYMRAGEFKTKCLSVMENVRRTRRSVVITKRDIPIAELVPLSGKRRSLFGCMKDSVKFMGNMTASTGERWDADS